MRVLTTTGDGTATPVDVPVPVPASDEVLVRVDAATINYVDRFISSGAAHRLGLITHDDPVGLGWDAVGRVEAVGAAVRTLVVGDRVAGVRVADDSVYGAIAEHVTLPEADVAPVPDTLTSTQAAAIGMNALTVAQALELFGDADGRTLLVTGAAGGLGGAAIEQAVAAEWRVTGLARKSDRDYVESRGARTGHRAGRRLIRRRIRRRRAAARRPSARGGPAALGGSGRHVLQCVRHRAPSRHPRGDRVRSRGQARRARPGITAEARSVGRAHRSDCRHRATRARR